MSAGSGLEDDLTPRSLCAVNVVTIGRGNVGGGLAELWRRAGHDVTELGREGGDASAADAALLAVPAATIADALGKVTGLGGLPVIDSTNVVRDPRPDGFDSMAAYVKSLTGGPVAKAFNANFARLYDRLGQAAEKPAMVFAADDGARAITETLIGDAGDLTNAASFGSAVSELSETLEAARADGRAGSARAS